MDHAKKAVEYYSNHFNCSQSIFATFATELGMDEKLALRLGTNFGSGERKGILCGACAGALMVLGLMCGHCDNDDTGSKEKAYKTAEEFMNRMTAKKGTVICRELLGLDLTDEKQLEKIKEENLFYTLCPEIVKDVAEILDDMIEEGLCPVK